MSGRLLVTTALCIILSFVKCEENCDKLGTLMYEDVGCKPVTVTGKSCPSHFECGEFDTSKDNCIFQAKKLAIGEQADDDVTYASCNAACTCREQVDKADFTCAILDCPEWLGVPVKPGCYRNYTLGKCCSTGQICPPFDKVTKCNVDGKEYSEGERFEPENTCLTCVCQKNFEGKLEAPFCQRSVCAVQLRNSEKLAKNCAPVYLETGETLCCPSLWACPSKTDQIKTITPELKTNDPSSLKCKWGKQEVKTGDGLDTKVEYFDGKPKDVTCECVLPPFLTCKEKK